MAQKTSLYLSDELAARIKDSGLPPAELIRRGLDLPDVVAAKVREGLATLLDERLGKPHP
jgi:hypothetical protein